MTPRELIQAWVDAFNRGDAEALEAFYAEEAVNHQMPNSPVRGKAAIGAMFRDEFAAAPEMHCEPVQILEDGSWGALEWRDPKGFRGCGFFEVVGGRIQAQRGYWDRLSFNRLYGTADANG